MILYSRPDDPAAHGIRLVLAEKAVGVKVVEVQPEAPPEDLLHLNPYGTVPTLVAREVTLYDPRIIAEYIDERYPHPPLLPADPVQRARTRLFISEIGGSWYELCDEVSNGAGRGRARARCELTEAIVSSDELFAAGTYLLNAHYGLADCVAIPVLWRLRYLGVHLPPEARAIRNYMQRIFRRPNFVRSLVACERAMVAG